MRIGPYEILGELGRGGMGVVYRARHTQLGREVALKVIGGDGAIGSTAATALGTESLERFRREAQAAGALADIPGVVGVHDVGEGSVASDATNPTPDARRVLYLAMDLIEGRPLDAVIAEGELSPIEAAGIAEQVARTLAAAHARGVLHRDVKPGNILIESARAAAGSATKRPVPPASGPDRARVAGAAVPGPAPVADGEPRARLADFGLARRFAADAALVRLTHSGELLGTPAYMAPEQAMGQGLDARADVYALGATLHEMCAGAPPFGGDSIHAVITRVLREPPPSLRRLDPAIPAALDAIVQRCLAKRPADRYPSAADLADDLARFRRGETVHARPAGHAGHALRTVRRHPLQLLGALAISGIASVALAQWPGWRDRDTRASDALPAVAGAASRAELAAQVSAAFFELSRDTHDAMQRLEDAWHGAPPPDLAADLASVGTVVARVAAAYPAARVPAAWMALARGLADDPAAGEALAAAHAAAGEDPFPAILLARAQLGAYARGAPLPGVIFRAPGVTIRPFVEPEPLTRLRRGAGAALDAARASPLWPLLTHGQGYRAFADAAASLAAGRHADAAIAFEALRDDATLAGTAAEIQGLAHFLAGDPAAAAGAWARAARRGWPRAIRCVGTAWRSAAALAVTRGTDPRPLLEKAEAALAAGLAVRPGDRGLLCDQGGLCLDLARWHTDGGADGSRWLDRGMVAFDAALAGVADPAEAAAALVGRADGHAQRAHAAADRGGDPTPHVAAGLADLDAAILGDPADVTARVNRAHALVQAAELAGRRGEDPDPPLAAAIRDLEAALVLAPELSELYGERAVVHLAAARLGGLRGADPRDALAAAVADAGAAIAGRPEDASAWARRARARTELGARLGATSAGLDMLAQAIADFGEALRRRPDDLGALADRAVAQFRRAEAATGLGEAPDRDIAGARADYDAVLARHPGQVNALNNRANLHLLRARIAARAGTSPREALADALSDYGEALRLRPGYAYAHMNRAQVHLQLADRDAAEGADAGPALERALADATAAASAQPGFVAAHEARGTVCERLGRTAEAIAAYETALAVSPDAPRARARLAALRAGR